MAKGFSVAKNVIKHARIIVTIVAVIVLAWYMARNYKQIEIQNYRYIILSVLIPLFVIPLIVNNRWKYFLSLHDVHESVIDLAKINFTAIFYGLVLPSSQGYDAIRILMIEKRHPDKRGKVGSTVILERMIGLVALCLMALLAVGVMPEFVGSKAIVMTVLIGAPLLICLCLIMVSRPVYQIFYKLFYSKSFKYGVINTALSYLNKLHESLIESFKIKVFFKSIIYIVLFQLSTIINVYLVYRSLGVNLPLSIHLVIMPIVYIVSMVPISISGIGVREGAFAFFYGTQGVAGPQAVLASLLNYAILMLIPALIGFIISIVSPVTFKQENLAKDIDSIKN